MGWFLNNQLKINTYRNTVNKNISKKIKYLIKYCEKI